jgi:hypothetical protein
VVTEDPAAVAAREMVRARADERLKWALAAGGVGFVAFAVFQFLRDTKDALRAAAARPRQPWDVP